MSEFSNEIRDFVKILLGKLPVFFFEKMAFPCTTWEAVFSIFISLRNQYKPIFGIFRQIFHFLNFN